jgi:GTP-binding protein
MNFLVNSSPLSGSEGKAMTVQQLLARLEAEAEINLALKFETGTESGVFKVYGRGEMHLGVLVETIRREGFELAVSPPEVVIKRNERDELLEPFEEVTVDCDSEYSSSVIEKMTKRRADILKMVELNGKMRLVFKCPTRGLIGFGSEFKTDTRGTGVMSYSFIGFENHRGHLEKNRKGCLISMADGLCTAYALADLESRGTLFVSPGDRVYKGMVVGECSRSTDIEINPCRQKELTNVRQVLKDENVRLGPARSFTLEDLMAYVNGKNGALIVLFIQLNTI